MKKYILPISLLASTLYDAQTNTENYIQSRTYLEPVASTSTTAKQFQTVSYYDGLGRPKQIVNVKASPLGNDVVTKIEYDPFGRQTKDYLSVPQTGSSNGAIYGNPLANVTSTPYGTEKIYSEKILEASPLERIRQQTQIGNDWTNKPVTFGYETNTATDVKKFLTTTTWPNNSTNSVLTQSGNYGAAQLYRNTVTDEDGNAVIQFTNGEGQILLIRKMNGSTPTDTYYVYNEYNLLAYIISPLASVKTSLTQSDLDELCYQYRYDGRKREVERKVPGRGWDYKVYDNQDRLVMTQDANLQASGEWLFTKYDKFGRVTYAGITTDSSSRSNLQSTFNGIGLNNVERTTSGFAQPGLLVYYDNLASNNYPNTITKLLSVNYYDTYPAGTPAIPATILTQSVMPQIGSVSTKSLITASFVNNVETNGWTKSYSWYDIRGRIIGTHTTNHLGGYTKTESLLDFAGVMQKTDTYHKRRNNDTELEVKEEFVYDNQNRLLKHYHEVIGKSPKELLADNHYNEVGKLNQKKVGGTGTNPLQTIDYAYNIRGWMTGINSNDISSTPRTLGNGKLFGYKIKYNDPENTSLAPAKYNGNISEIDWIYKDGELKRYGYQYDGLNRLLNGIYQDPDQVQPLTYINSESIEYDLNGNISHLYRNGKHGKYYTAIQVDNLTYNYINGNGNSNKLQSITDATANSSGYEGGGQNITYDVNGNMTSMLDKGISAITYNFLNLPRQINQKANTIKYYYSGNGVKLKKQFTLVNNLGTKLINTEYLGGFQYSTPNTDPLRKALEQPDDNTMEVARAGEEEAFSPDLDRAVVLLVDTGTPEVDNMILSFFPTSEGYYDFENFRYIYQYKDQWGNIRVSYVRNASTGAIETRDRNDYYPFGMSFLKSNLASLYDPMAIPYNYKMQGQELQETGFYQYKYRQYMPDVGRFFNIDPLAAKYPYNSTYAFQENKIGRGVELEGLEILENNTGYFAIRGNEMQVKRAPTTQTYIGEDGKRHATFKPGDIGLTTSGYNPDAPRITTGTTGLKLDSYKYDGPVPDAAKMQNTRDKISNKGRQSFKTEKTGAEMWNLKQQSIDNANAASSGIKELAKLIDLAVNIPNAFTSTNNYVQASKDVNSVLDQGGVMGDAMKYVDSSGIEMNQQTRNDVVNFVVDGTLPPGTDTQNGLIIQNGTTILNSNGLPVRPTPEQEEANNKILP